MGWTHANNDVVREHARHCPDDGLDRKLRVFNQLEARGHTAGTARMIGACNWTQHFVGGWRAEVDRAMRVRRGASG